MRKCIPIQFVAAKLAVNTETLAELLDLNDGRSDVAKAAAIRRFTAIAGVKRLPGGVWPLKAIERACEK